MTGVEYITNAFADALQPAKELDLAEWAAENIILSPEYSAARGRFTPWPFQVEPMSVMSPRHPCERVALLCGAQVMKTQLLLNLVGFAIDVDPGPILFVEPRAADAEFVSKSKLAPMLRDTQCLRGKVADAKSRDSGNTIEHKSFKGGSVSFATANSPLSLRMRSIRYLLLDEISSDAYRAGKDGDPISNAEERASFWNKKIIYASTPTLEGDCRITDMFRHSDQRQWFVPCPHCRHEQVLEWHGLKFSTSPEKVVEFTDEFGQKARRYIDPDEPMYLCESCDRLIREGDTRDVGRYIVQNPAGKYPGFRVNQLVCPTKPWAEVVQKWIKAQGKPDSIRSFVNNVLAETWQEKGEAPPWEVVYGRRENYSLGKIQPGVLFLTAGADVQKDRIEVSIYGWGRNRQCWLVDHVILSGRTSEERIWTELTDIRLRSYRHPGGAMLNITRFCIDSGYESQMVYRWVREQHTPDAMAVDGRTHLGGMTLGQPSPVDVDIAGRKIKRGIRVWPVDTGKIKSELYGRLSLPRPEEGQEDYPNGYLHLPQVSEEFCRQLTAEHLVSKLNNKGYRVYEWQKLGDRRNETMDCHVYARAGAHQLGVDRFGEREWRRIEAIVLPSNSFADSVERPAIEIASEPAATVTVQQAPPAFVVRQAQEVQPPRRPAAPVRSSWLSR